MEYLHRDIQIQLPEKAFDLLMRQLSADIHALRNELTPQVLAARIAEVQGQPAAPIDPQKKTILANLELLRQVLYANRKYISTGPTPDFATFGISDSAPSEAPPA